MSAEVSAQVVSLEVYKMKAVDMSVRDGSCGHMRHSVKHLKLKNLNIGGKFSVVSPDCQQRPSTDSDWGRDESLHPAEELHLWVNCELPSSESNSHFVSDLQN